MQALADRHEDVVIVRWASRPTPPCEAIVVELFCEPFLIIVRADHPLANHPGKIALAALAQEEFVFYGHQMGTTLPGQILALCRKAGFEPRINQIAGANSTIIALVAVGLGIAIVPEAMLRLSHEAVVAKGIADADAATSTWMMRHRTNRSPPAQTFFALASAAARVPNLFPSDRIPNRNDVSILG
jgi:DNA-binding transcriptional LysR family regulator